MRYKDLKVRVADFRRAAQKISSTGALVTITQLARSMSVPTLYVTRVFTEMPWLKKELQVQTEIDARRARFIECVLRLRRSEVTPSYSSVARALGVSEHSVKTYCRRHPDVLAACGVVSLSPHYAYNKAEFFRERIQELEDRGIDPTPAEFAAQYGIDRSNLYKIIHANREVAKLFKLENLYRPNEKIA